MGTKTGKYVPPSLRSGADAAQRRGESMGTRRQGIEFRNYIASCLVGLSVIYLIKWNIASSKRVAKRWSYVIGRFGTFSTI